MKYMFYFVLLLLGFLSGYFTGERFANEQIPMYKERIVRDTVVKIQQNEPIIIKKAKPEIIYRTDSVFVAKPFTALIDTVIIRDTVVAEYNYPENTFSLALRRTNDTLLIPEVKIIKTKKESPWIKPLIFISGAVSGYFIK